MRLPVAAASATVLVSILLAAAARGDPDVPPAVPPVVPTVGAPRVPLPAVVDQLALVHAPAYRIESLAFRFTDFEQDGLGYQSAAGPPAGPGSQRTSIQEMQSEVVASLGERLVERLVTSVDVVTAASPNHRLYGLPVGTPVDTISSASRLNEAEEIASDSTYSWRHDTQLGLHADFHLEEPLESWGVGATFARSLADDNTVLAASLYQIVDWFDHFGLDGKRYGRGVRTTSNANLGLTQLLSPTTVVAASYGFTIQGGTLTNTWNSVPLTDGSRGTEMVPRQRLRHAFAGRLVQWLPWQGALKVGYRFYVDSWGSTAQTVEGGVSQRFGRRLTLEVNGRLHRQTAVDFFGILFDSTGTPFRTSDSDLDGLTAYGVSAGARWDQPIGHVGHQVYFALTGERYVRSNDLQIDFISGAVGWQQ